MTDPNAFLTAQARFDSPLGPLTAAATERGISGLWFDGQRHHPGMLDAPSDPDQRWLARLRVALDAYWRGAMGTGARQSIENLDAEQTGRVRAALAERLERYRQADGYHVPATALIGTATR